MCKLVSSSSSFSRFYAFSIQDITNFISPDVVNLTELLIKLKRTYVNLNLSKFNALGTLEFIWLTPLNPLFLINKLQDCQTYSTHYLIITGLGLYSIIDFSTFSASRILLISESNSYPQTFAVRRFF